jgi:cytochrome c oxidase subunit 2
VIRVRGQPMLALGILPILSACDGVQSITGGDGVHAEQFNNLFTLFMIVCGIAYALVLAFLTGAIIRRRREPRDHERGLARTLTGWVAFIVVGLSLLTIASYVTDRDASAAAAGTDRRLQLAVTANQWWWDVEYEDPEPTDQIRTANEIHLAVGVPTHIKLESNDVIHSFWIPNLAGKQDIIPGRTNDILILPTKAGVYRGQCAEYCGAQHAHMSLDVIVHPRAEFYAWRKRQLVPPPAPSSPLTLAGYNYVTTRECSVCHNINGTPASGKVAPDLTHLASRRSIAAGTFPMTRGHLYAWIADPQGPKPGNKMPYVGLETNELHAVVAYLETLK